MTAATGRLAAGWRSGPLAVRSFRLLCAGQFTSTIGDFCYAVALPWLVLSADGGAAFAADAVSFGVSALTLLLIPRRAVRGSMAAVAAEAAAADRAAGDGAAEGAAAGQGGVLALLKTSRALQVILVVVIAANLASGGMGDVALPSLAHASFGAAGYGALLACLAVGGLIGTLAATRTGGLKAPVMFASAMFLIEAAGIGLIPYLGGEAGAAAALFVVGACNGLGNVTFLTVLQKWAPPALLGRVMSMLMLCAFGSFPLSVAVSGVLVRHLGPALFFPVAGGLVVVAILGGLTQREFRTFGAAESARTPDVPAVGAETRTAR